MERESMEFDVVIVGGGPSGLLLSQLLNLAGIDVAKAKPLQRITCCTALTALPRRSYGLPQMWAAQVVLKRIRSR